MKTYPLTPQQFDALRTRLLQMKIALPLYSEGVIAQNGIELKFHYDGAKLTLSIQKKPALIPGAMIWKTVDEWIAG